MRTLGPGLGARAVAGTFTLGLVLFAGSLPASSGPAGAAGAPQPVSPGRLGPGAVAELRCPTFSWAGVEGAPGYELAIFRVSPTPDVDPVLVARASLPRNADTWTPPLDQCLERGERYAWSVAAAGFERATEDGLDWAPALLFDVAHARDAAPSQGELEQAVATLQRYLATRGGSAVARDHAAASHAADPPGAGDPRHGADPSGSASASGSTRIAAPASTPSLGTPSLVLGGNLSLGPASNVFKNDTVFLWDDSDGNTALGRTALASVTTGLRNTAVGRQALERVTGGPLSGDSSDNTAIGDQALRYTTTGRRNTAAGAFALRANTTGQFNTGSGYRALLVNTTGSSNVAAGAFALYSNTTGFQNVAIGINALRDSTTAYHNTAVGTGALDHTTGSRNLGIGRYAGFHTTTGVDNIFIGSGAIGVNSDTHTIRIGGMETGTDQFEQNRTFVNGIRGTTTANANAIAVVIDSAGQLGTVSSSRAVKQDIHELGSLADRLLELRPVAFRYKQHVETDPEAPFEFGLLAEEVAEVLPELVVFDEHGQPETVKYHLLSSLLLGALLQQHGALEQQRSELERVRSRLAAIESSGGSASRR